MPSSANRAINRFFVCPPNFPDPVGRIQKTGRYFLLDMVSLSSSAWLLAPKELYRYVEFVVCHFLQKMTQIAFTSLHFDYSVQIPIQIMPHLHLLDPSFLAVPMQT
jgi:hypothetical protein